MGIYGGDFGLAGSNISRHIRLLGNFGTIFAREIDAKPELFVWKAAEVLPKSCFMENEWRLFFKLWNMRLECWGCHDIDDAIVSLWPSLEAAQEATKGWFEACWSGTVLIALPLLSVACREENAWSPSLEQRCAFALPTVEHFTIKAGMDVTDMRKAR